MKKDHISMSLIIPCYSKDIITDINKTLCAHPVSSTSISFFINVLIVSYGKEIPKVSNKTNCFMLSPTTPLPVTVAGQW